MKKLFRIATAATMLMAAGWAHAQGKPLDDDALAGVWGQALFTLTNQSLDYTDPNTSVTTTFDFSRLTINADIKLNANLGGVLLGTTGTGSDIDIPVIQFGRTDGTAAQRTVSITDPYVEFVYTGIGTARQVVGMRLGFGGISGDIGLQMNTVSGSLQVTTSSGQIDATGSRITTGSCTSPSSPCTVSLSQLYGVTAGNASGASSDFFLSVLKQAVAYPTSANSTATSVAAQSGFWLNWRDRLTALSALPVNNATS